MDEKKLIDLYKKQLAQSSEKAPEGLWDDIVQKMDATGETQLIHQYKEELARSSEKAPEGLWDNIGRKMDIDEVWGNIAAELEQGKKAIGFWTFTRRVAAVAGLLVATSLSVWLVSNMKTNTVGLAREDTNTAIPPEISDEQSFNNPMEVNPKADFFISDSAQIDEIKLKSTSFAFIPEDQNTSTPPDEFDTTLIDEVKLAEQQSIQPIDLLKLAVIPVVFPEQKIAENPELLLEDTGFYDLQLADVSTGTFSFGLTTAVKNTWLFNHETFEGLDRSNGNRTGITLYPDIALSLRYQFSPRWEIESGVSLSSYTGQSYQQYIYGKYSQKNIALNYINAEIVANYKSKKRWIIRSNSIGHSSAIGLYMARLNSANETIAGEREEISFLYNSMDYGLVVGHNLDMNLSNRLSFSPGLRINWGLPNIYAGEYSIPSLKRTHNRSIELRFSLFYNFPR